jgi:hypothetical protein
VSGDGAGDAFAAEEPGADELAGVALVDGRAGRADGFAAVAARDRQDALADSVQGRDAQREFVAA